MGLITSALYSFGELSVLTGTVGITASMILVAIAGILLPYRNKELWRSSPASEKLAGIPRITVAGLVALPLLALIEWALLSDVNSGTSVSGSPRIVAYVTTIFLIGLPLYYGQTCQVTLVPGLSRTHRAERPYPNHLASNTLVKGMPARPARNLLGSAYRRRGGWS